MDRKKEKLEILLNKVLEVGGMSILADSRKFRAYAKDLNESDIMDLDRDLHFCDDSFLRYFYDARNDTSGKEIIQAGRLTEQYLVDSYYMNDEKAGEFSRLFTEVILQYKRLDTQKIDISKTGKLSQAPEKSSGGEKRQNNKLSEEKQHSNIASSDGKQTESILKKGDQVNDLFRILTDPDYFPGMSYSDNYYPDQIIKAIRFTDEAPPSGINLCNLAALGLPVYAWFESDSKTIFIYTESDKVYFNEDSKLLFSDLQELEECYFDWKKIDTSSVTDMSDMFIACIKLRNLDLSGFDTGSVKKMCGMFFDCSSLTNLDLSSFNTSSATDMANMFSGCSSLTNLNLNSFNTSSVTDMFEMFSGCSSLTNLDLSSFNTSSVKDMSNMFFDCSSLTNLDLSSFSTSSVKNMSYMFSGCSKLERFIIKHGGLITKNQDILKEFRKSGG